MKCVLALILAISGSVALAESGSASTQGQGQPNITVNIQPSPAPNPYGGQKIFSDGVFDSVGKGSSAPSVSKSPYSGSERAVGEEPDYNYRQRKQWADSCNPSLKSGDMSAYRECFEKERKKSSDEIARNREDVERKQNSPLRNSQALPGVDDARGPAFGGVDEETSNEND